MPELNIDEIETLVNELDTLYHKEKQITERIDLNKTSIHKIKVKSNTEAVYNYIKANSGKVTKEDIVVCNCDTYVVDAIIHNLWKTNKIEWNGVAYTVNVDAVRSINERIQEIENIIDELR